MPKPVSKKPAWLVTSRQRSYTKATTMRRSAGRCAGCGIREVPMGIRCEVCRNRARRYYKSGKYAIVSKQRVQRVKDAAYVAYGGYKCACCGELEPLFLELDHINNDGHTHRYSGKNRVKGHNLYLWLRRHKYPEGFQVLCCSCNHGKHRNGGICPHQSPDWDSRFIGACA